MSVVVQKYKRGGHEVRIFLRDVDGRKIERRYKSPVSSKSGSRRWGEAKERALLDEIVRNGRLESPNPGKEVPTLREFAPRFLASVKADRHKPSGVADKESRLRTHLVPILGDKRVDAITNEDVQRLKHDLRDRAPSSVNNTLSVLNRLLKVALELGVIDEMPCMIRQVRRQETEAAFWDFDEYERLVRAARDVDWRAEIVVLLGGEAGLRSGEMRALRQTDVDRERRQLTVSRSEWRGQVGSTKGGRKRVVPMTGRLAEALAKHRHLADLVLCREDGRALSEKIVQTLVERAERRAGLPHRGPHCLRHSFCSHLAMRGAPVRAIQELAGHANLTTTMRYMHLSPRAIVDAIRLLELPNPMETPLEAAG
jgi:integrase